MPNKEVINHRQMAWMISSIIVGTGLISSHNELIRISRMDAWFSYALPIVYAFFIAALYSYLSLNYPGKNIFTIVYELTGKWLGGIINLFFFIHIWFILM